MTALFSKTALTVAYLTLVCHLCRCALHAGCQPLTSRFLPGPAGSHNRCSADHDRHFLWRQLRPSSVPSRVELHRASWHCVHLWWGKISQPWPVPGKYGGMIVFFMIHFYHQRPLEIVRKFFNGSETEWRSIDFKKIKQTDFAKKYGIHAMCLPTSCFHFS